MRNVFVVTDDVRLTSASDSLPYPAEHSVNPIPSLHVADTLGIGFDAGSFVSFIIIVSLTCTYPLTTWAVFLVVY